MNSAFTQHLEILGLSRIPFPTTPDAVHYFNGNDLNMEIAEAMHCVLSHKGFVLITGEVGLGKSTLVRKLVDGLISKKCVVSLVMNTALRGSELLDAIILDFGIKPTGRIADDLETLNKFLLAHHRQDGTAAIIIDDAQNLNVESLELIRLLTNFETSQEKLVQIVLCGQTELCETLATPAIRQLASRIVKHIELQPLSAEIAEQYIRFRLETARANGLHNHTQEVSVSKNGMRALFQHSKGNPRKMHIILDRCLYGLVSLKRYEIDEALINQAAHESGIRPAPRIAKRHRQYMGLAAVTASLTVAAVVAANVFSFPNDMSSVHTQPLQAAAIVAPSIVEFTALAADTAALAESTQSPLAVIPILQTHDAQIQLNVEPTLLNMACVEQFGLASDLKLLREGITNNDLPAVQGALKLRDPDLRVLLIPQTQSGLVDNTSSQACALHNGSNNWMAWIPQSNLDGFQWGYQSSAVGQLQQTLKAAGFYRANVDGIVGSQTVFAIAQFQRINGLQSSGFPDGLTQYLIELKTAPSVLQEQES